MYVHVDRGGLVTGLAEHREGAAPDPWVAWSWDGQVLRACNDPLGFRPLFYAADSERVVVGTTLAEVVRAAGARELDDDALAVFLRLGYFLADQTPFASVRALPPDGVLSWSRGRWSVTGGPEIDVAAVHAPREALLDEFAERFAASIAARPPVGLVTLPLSGGRDSRHILAELLAQNVPVDRTVTVDRDDLAGSKDAATGGAVANHARLPHHLYPAARRTLALEERKCQITHLCADEHWWLLPMTEHLTKHRGTVYDGIGGDVLSSGVFMSRAKLDILHRGDVASFARQVPPYGDVESSIASMFSPELARRWCAQRAFAAIEREVSRHLAAPNPISSFYFWNRTRREIAMVPFGLMVSPTLTVRTPYLDLPLVRFLRSIPADVLLDTRFHTDTIARVAPDLGALPYGDLSPSEVPGRLYWATRARMPGFRLAREVRQAGRVRGWLPGSPYAAFRRSASVPWMAGIPAWLHTLAGLGSEVTPTLR